MSGLASIPLALETVATLWRWYFPQEVFNPTDSRLTSVQILLDMLGSDFNNIMRVLDMRNGSLPLSVPYILGKVPFDDFLSILIGQPSEVLGCMVRGNIELSCKYITLVHRV